MKYDEQNLQKRIEGINHIVSSAEYWSGDTIDNSYYLNNLGIEKAFKEACHHVRNSHHIILRPEDIAKAKNMLGLK
jgi:hypothetical protein